jgi:chemotaxis protein MotB
MDESITRKENFMSKKAMAVGAVLLAAAMIGGCVPKAEVDKCVRRNEIQQNRIRELEEAQQQERLRADQCQQQLDALLKTQGFSGDKLRELEAALAEKNKLINDLTAQLGQMQLPPALSNALADWAKKAGDMVEYDEKTGLVRFKSDLTFDSGSDVVKANAQKQLAELSTILNSADAQNFDVLVVGHTDDQPISRVKNLHPTNWHLSVHRAISVEKILAGAGIVETRLSVMGFGEFRPLEPNAPGKKGNAKNRRVDIYIVPAGQIHISAKGNG